MGTITYWLNLMWFKAIHCVKMYAVFLARSSTIIKTENNQWESKWGQDQVRTGHDWWQRNHLGSPASTSSINYCFQNTEVSVCGLRQTRGKQCLLSVLTQVADTASLTHTQCRLLLFTWPTGKYTTNNVARYRKKKNNSCVSLSKQSCDLCALRREMPSGLFSFGGEGLEGTRREG